MLIFKEFFNTHSDQNILQNAPNCTIFTKISWPPPPLPNPGNAPEYTYRCSGRINSLPS